MQLHILCHCCLFVIIGTNRKRVIASLQGGFHGKCRVAFDLIFASIAVAIHLNQVVVIAGAEQGTIHSHEGLSIFIALVVNQCQLDHHLDLNGTRLRHAKVVLEATGKIRLRRGVRRT